MDHFVKLTTKSHSPRPSHVEAWCHAENRGFQGKSNLETETACRQLLTSCWFSFFPEKINLRTAQSESQQNCRGGRHSTACGQLKLVQSESWPSGCGRPGRARLMMITAAAPPGSDHGRCTRQTKAETWSRIVGLGLQCQRSQSRCASP